MKKLSDYLRIKEAAAYLGVSFGTLRNWEKEGKIKAYRNPMNDHRLYDKEELEEILKKVQDPIIEETL